MLQKLSEQIQSCYERAAEAKRKAEATTDQRLKTDFEMEARWLGLARSYAFTDGLGDFTAEMSQRRQKADHDTAVQCTSPPAIETFRVQSKALSNDKSSHNGTYGGCPNEQDSLTPASVGKPIAAPPPAGCQLR
jgi:hypothetical protein